MSAQNNIHKLGKTAAAIEPEESHQLCEVTGAHSSMLGIVLFLSKLIKLAATDDYNRNECKHAESERSTKKPAL
jgi:hypothetical protein